LRYWALFAVLWLTATPLFSGDVAETLRTAKIVQSEEVGSGITRPILLTLEGGTRGIWKDPGSQFVHPRTGVLVKDSWRHEIAAYRLSEELGLGLVPPTVERRLNGEVGSLQLWIEGATALEDWGGEVDVKQLRRVRLFRLLTNDQDAHKRNVLVGPGGKLWAIDSSRAFAEREALLEFLLDVNQAPRAGRDARGH
jgi:hypothetical protein